MFHLPLNLLLPVAFPPHCKLRTKKPLQNFSIVTIKQTNAKSHKNATDYHFAWSPLFMDTKQNRIPW
jgi:hypothetical protein